MRKRLRESDWEDFKAERRYRERQTPMPIRTDGRIWEMPETEAMGMEELLDSVENRELYEVLRGIDEVGGKILILKMQGYQVAEIAEKLGISEKAVYRRLDRIKEKIKKVVE